MLNVVFMGHRMVAFRRLGGASDSNVQMISSKMRAQDEPSLEWPASQMEEALGELAAIWTQGRD